MFRQMLLDRRDLILGDYRSILDDMQEYDAPGESGAQSNLPTHQADLALDDELNEMNTHHVELKRDLLVQIDEALRRIEDKTYGICMKTGKPIDKNRLLVKPWAKYGIDVARQMGENA